MIGLLLWKVTGLLRRKAEPIQVAQASNGVLCWYIPKDPRYTPGHGTVAYDQGYDKEDNPYPNWRKADRARWDRQWEEACESYAEAIGYPYQRSE